MDPPVLCVCVCVCVRFLAGWWGGEGGGGGGGGGQRFLLKTLIGTPQWYHIRRVEGSEFSP